MPQSPRLYMFWSWHIQIPLDGMIRPGAEYDVYVSAGFDGPGLPHGDPESPDALDVDRVFPVKARR